MSNVDWPFRELLSDTPAPTDPAPANDEGDDNYIPTVPPWPAAPPAPVGAALTALSAQNDTLSQANEEMEKNLADIHERYENTRHQVIADQQATIERLKERAEALSTELTEANARITHLLHEISLRNGVVNDARARADQSYLDKRAAEQRAEQAIRETGDLRSGITTAMGMQWHGLPANGMVCPDDKDIIARAEALSAERDAAVAQISRWSDDIRAAEQRAEQAERERDWERGLLHDEKVSRRLWKLRAEAAEATAAHATAFREHAEQAELERDETQERAARMAEALTGVIEAWVNPGDGGPFEDGEVPALDAARAALREQHSSQHGH